MGSIMGSFDFDARQFVVPPNSGNRDFSRVWKKLRTALATTAVSCGVVLAPLSETAVWAETILLKSGGHIEGELLNPDRAKEDNLQLKLAAGGRLAIAPAQVQRVIRKSEGQLEYETRLPKMVDTAAAHWEMAEWCKETGLLSQRRTHLEKVIALDPEHEKARIALGYNKISGTWMRQEEFMKKQGYILHKGSWKLPQQIEIEEDTQAWELLVREWRKKVNTWVGQLGSRRDAEARNNLLAINEVAAVPPVVELLSDESNPPAVRGMMLEIVERIPQSEATNALIMIALKDKNENLRDRALELLKKRNPSAGLSAFTKELKNKNNKIVNRAAVCLQHLDLPEATMPLIDALVTNHKYMLQQGGGPGQMTTSFGGGTSGSADGNGMGGLGMGGKPKMIQQDHQNVAVLGALTALNPGINFAYDQKAWRRWYGSTQSAGDFNLRRSND